MEKAVKVLSDATAVLGDDYRIVIAEDGSTDGSDQIAKRLAAEDPKVIWFHSDHKLGRGLALKNAWSRVDGDLYAFIDCDLATDMSYYSQLIRSIIEGYDFATGSRYIKDAVVHRPALRYSVSRVYNLMLRVVFRTKVMDHQLGFKAFSGRLIKDIMSRCDSDDWFWDTEIIVRSLRAGYKGIEFPVEWEEKRGSKTPVKRLIKDIYVHGKGFLRLSVEKS